MIYQPLCESISSHALQQCCAEAAPQPPSEPDLLAAGADVQGKAESYHVGQYGRAAVAHKRQGYAGYWHETHGHCDVFEYLEGEHAEDSGDDESAVKIGGIVNDLHQAHEKESEKDDYEKTA